MTGVGAGMDGCGCGNDVGGAGRMTWVGVGMTGARMGERKGAGAQGALWWVREFGWGSGFRLRRGGCESG